jgi:hypothetical protein
VEEKIKDWERKMEEWKEDEEKAHKYTEDCGKDGEVVHGK